MLSQKFSYWKKIYQFKILKVQQLYSWLAVFEEIFHFLIDSWLIPLLCH